MKLGANILWFLLGGWLLGLIWFAAAIVMTLSIIGLPWARACWEIALLSFAPFGREVISDAELTGSEPMPLGLLRLLANLIWLPFGVILCIGHLAHAVLMVCTIIGIPFALQDLKLAGISLFPVGKRVVPTEVADAARAANAANRVAQVRRSF
jgi:uncharacterized membrane protein YccF (DUF307 family)